MYGQSLPLISHFNFNRSLIFLAMKVLAQPLRLAFNRSLLNSLSRYCIENTIENEDIRGKTVLGICVGEIDRLIDGC